MGVFEMEKILYRHKAIAETLASPRNDDYWWRRLCGGSCSVGYADKMTHISTGGGASLEFWKE